MKLIKVNRRMYKNAEEYTTEDWYINATLIQAIRAKGDDGTEIYFEGSHIVVDAPMSDIVPLIDPTPAELPTARNRPNARPGKGS